MGIIVVTGTGTGVGKTMVTAALASVSPQNTAVVKLAQTGVGPGEWGDIDEVGLLSRCTALYELARYPDPLSPHHAAMISGLPELDRDLAVTRVAELESEHELVIVEGSGGVMVPFAVKDPWNVQDFSRDLEAEILLVTAAGLGTLNHTMLALEYLDPDILGVVIGSWPAQPDLATRCNVADLGRMTHSGRLLGALPEGLATRSGFADGTGFAAQAEAALDPRLGGSFDWKRFLDAARP